MSNHPMAQPWTNWRPIETAPRDGSRFLACTSDDVVMGKFVNGEYVAADSFHGNRDTTPTHWAPIPEPPPR
jgi:hypothetical protein